MAFKHYLFGFLSLLLSLSVTAQQQDINYCGTQDGKVPWLVKYQENPLSFEKSGSTLYVPLTIHIVGDDDGNGYISYKKFLSAFCTLQEDFAASNIQFFIEGELNYIDNSNYYEHSFQQGAQMMNIYKVNNTINCYVVESPAGNCGYSSYNNGIALNKGCMSANQHTWAHEIGHFLSLPHTFYGWEGYEHDYSQPAPNFVNGNAVERLDGSNCNFSGDGFCDTPPDYLSNIWSCSSSNTTSIPQLDPNNQEFESDGTMIMAYSNGCENRFSDEQIQAMRANLETEKQSYLYNQTPVVPVDLTDFTPISPLEGELIETYNQVTFAWEPVPNATEYFLEISPLESFGFTLFRYIISETSYTTNEIPAGVDYFWRIRAYNNYYTCEEVTEPISFQTGSTLSAVEEISAVNQFMIYPNPVTASQSITAQIDLKETTDLEINLLSTTGAMIQSIARQLPAGTNRETINTQSLAPGIYFLQLRSDNQTSTKKLIIH
jgi:hypothetical protein